MRASGQVQHQTELQRVHGNEGLSTDGSAGVFVGEREECVGKGGAEQINELSKA